MHGQANEVGEDVIAWASNYLDSYRGAIFSGPVSSRGGEHPFTGYLLLGRK